METTQKPYAFSRKVFCEGMRDGVPHRTGLFCCFVLAGHCGPHRRADPGAGVHRKPVQQCFRR